MRAHAERRQRLQARRRPNDDDDHGSSGGSGVGAVLAGAPPGGLGGGSGGLSGQRARVSPGRQEGQLQGGPADAGQGDDEQQVRLCNGSLP